MYQPAAIDNALLSKILIFGSLAYPLYSLDSDGHYIIVFDCVDLYPKQIFCFCLRCYRLWRYSLYQFDNI